MMQDWELRRGGMVANIRSRKFPRRRMPPSARRPRSSSSSGKLIASFFALLLLGAGLFFTWSLWNAYQRAKKLDTWRPVPCVIVISRVAEEKRSLSMPTEFRAFVEYSYIVEDVPRQSRKIRRFDGAFAEKSRAEAVVKQYPEGAGTTCYVNPDNPAEAVLERESKKAVYTLWFPMLFVIGGGGLLVSVWRRRRQEEEEDDDNADGDSGDAAAETAGAAGVPAAGRSEGAEGAGKA
jgi:hypothetical protein